MAGFFGWFGWNIATVVVLVLFIAAHTVIPNFFFIDIGLGAIFLIIGGIRLLMDLPVHGFGFFAIIFAILLVVLSIICIQ